MKKTLKISLAILGGLVALLVILVILVFLLVDPNDFKPQIAQAVQSATGRELVLEGDLSLTFFPWFGLELGPAQLHNAQGFEPENMLAIKKAKFDVRVRPLLSKKLEAGMITLEGLEAHLAKGKDGRTNWDDLAKGKPTEQPKPAEPVESPESGKGAGLAGISVAGVRIVDASISYVDQTTGKDYRLRDFNLNIDDIRPNTPFPVKMAFDVQSASPPLSSRFELSATATVDAARRYAKLQNLAVTVIADGESLPGGRVEASLKAEVEADLTAGTASVSGLDLNAMGLKLLVDLKASGLPDKASFSGTAKVPAFSPKDLLKQMGSKPMVTNDPKALTSLSLDLGFSGDQSQVKLQPLAVKLDDTNLSGTGTVRYSPKLAAVLDLQADALDADRYLPPKAAEKGEPAASKPSDKPADAAAQKEPDLTGLRSLDLVINFKLGQLKINNLTTQNIDLAFHAKDGLVQMKSLTAELYQGQASLQASLDARPATPVLKAKTDLTGIVSGPLIHDLAGKDIIDGTASFKADITATGLTADAVRKTLNGTADFQFLDGAIYGINVAQMIRKASAVVLGQSLDDAEQVNKTDFAELSASLDILNGLATNQDLLMKSPLLRVDGKGQADLPSEKVDYLVTARIVGTLAGQGGTDQLQGLPVPIRVAGTFKKPSFKVDTKELGRLLVTSTAGTAVKDAVGGLLGGQPQGNQTAGDTVKEALGGLLQGVTKQPETQATDTDQTTQAPKQESQEKPSLEGLMKGFGLGKQ